MSNATKKLSKVEQINAGGYMQPRLRSMSESVRFRKVHVFNQQTGEISEMKATLGAAIKGAALLVGLELSVQDGKRPKAVPCELCGFPVRVRNKKGQIPRWCTECKKVDCTVCGKRLGACARVKGTTRCVTCSGNEKKARPRCLVCNAELKKKRPDRTRNSKCRPCYEKTIASNRRDFGDTFFGVEVSDASIRSIAEHSGTCLQTVRRALAGTATFSTCERVKASAAVLGIKLPAHFSLDPYDYALKPWLSEVSS